VIGPDGWALRQDPGKIRVLGYPHDRLQVIPQKVGTKLSKRRSKSHNPPRRPQCNRSSRGISHRSHRRRVPAHHCPRRRKSQKTGQQNRYGRSSLGPKLHLLSHPYREQAPLFPTLRGGAGPEQTSPLRRRKSTGTDSSKEPGRSRNHGSDRRGTLR